MEKIRGTHFPAARGTRPAHPEPLATGPVATLAGTTAHRPVQLRARARERGAARRRRRPSALWGEPGFEDGHLSDGWAKEAVIDVEHNLRSLLPKFSPGPMSIEFKCSGERSDVVLLLAYGNNRRVHRGSPIVLDLETMEMRKINSSHTSLLLEVDLSARLRAMKIF